MWYILVSKKAFTLLSMNLVLRLLRKHLELSEGCIATWQTSMSCKMEKDKLMWKVGEPAHAHRPTSLWRAESWPHA